MLNSLMLHQYRLTSTFDLLFEKDLGDWVKARSTTWYSQFLMSQYNYPRWIEHFKVSREFFSINNEAKTSHGKKRHILHVCNTCRDLCHMFTLQVCTWSIILLVQWIICHWQIHCSFGASRICLCKEYNVQKSSEVAWRRRDGRGDGYLQRLLWSSICPWCYKYDTYTHYKNQRNICWRFFFFKSKSYNMQLQVIDN